MELESVAKSEKLESPYKRCSRCVMDSTDREIFFNTEGVCNHCLAYEAQVPTWNLQEHIKNKSLEKTFLKIKEASIGQPYDSLIGLSGGVDSSYVAYLASKHGLRPLCVHLDNGWNSELAVNNIHKLVEQFKFELYTHVIDWEEFQDLQRSFFKADVVDLELLSDHAIFGVILQLAKKFKIKNILSGANFATEAIMPRTWVHRKQDLANIRAIQKKFGTRPIKTFPQVSTLEHVIAMFGFGYKVHKPLNWIDYNKKEVKKFLIESLGWRDYGGKHYESIFTKFYQAHILPKKFNIDKRKAHLSTLINSGQLTRSEALEELQKALYEPKDLDSDFEFVCKKLKFTKEELESYLQRPEVSHLTYGSDQGIYDFLFKVKTWLRI